MNGGEFRYTGSGITGFDGGFVIKGETDTGYWTYRFTPIFNTGAQLDSDGFPHRAGEYAVVGYYNNGRYKDYRTSALIVTPAALTVDVLLEYDSKIYDENTIIHLDSASLIGIIGDDDVSISVFGIPSYISPDVGNDIEVVFTDFEIGGEHAWNYSVIQPDSLFASITHAVYKGDISVVINDDLLRIGSELSFTASDDPSDYLVQWRVDGEDIEGANELTYIVKSGDVDKKISVVLISPCRNYEGESPPTDYVPYTINLVLGDTIPMGDDDVYFGEPGIVTAYAASKNGGYADITYVLYDSGLDSDSLTFSLRSLQKIKSAGSDTLRYHINPRNAVDGIVNIITTFYHRGISVTPGGSRAFDDLDCGYSFDDYYSITITQLGNAPTGLIVINLRGDNYNTFSLSKYTIPSIDIDAGVTIDVGVRAGIIPTDYHYNIYNTSINVAGYHINLQTIPVSVKIIHDYTDFVYRGGFHDHSCNGCELYKSYFCSYSSWSVRGEVHGRSCSVCFGVDSHEFMWSAWSFGDDAGHLRVCSLCDIIDSASHNDLSFLAIWTNEDSINHSRARNCNVCNKFMRTELQAHTWGNWGAWTQGDAANHHRTGSCTTAGCGRAAAVGTTAGTFDAHTWPAAWTNHDADNHRRLCTTAGCGRPQDQAHTWVNHDAANHRCPTCERLAAHTWGEWSGWTNIGSFHRQSRTCTTAGCGHVEHNDQPHVTSAWWNLGDGVHCTRSCTVCHVHLEHAGHAHSIWTDIHDGTHCVINCTRCGAAHLHVANHHEHSSGWWNLGDGHTCVRSCVLCSRHLEYAGHSHSTWIDIHDGTHCVTNCTRCGAEHTQVADHRSHISGWRDSHDGVHCHRGCGLCARYLGSQAHVWSGWNNISSTQHSRTCSDCSRDESQNHIWGNWGIWTQGNETQHTRSRTCTAAGCGATNTGAQNHRFQVYSQHSNANWNADNNNGQHLVTCIDCSRQYREPCAPWGIFPWGPGNGACARLCRGCLHTVETAEHTWSGSVCTRCGATR
jgi:hypothetical protein